MSHTNKAIEQSRPQIINIRRNIVLEQTSPRVRAAKPPSGELDQT